MERRWAPIVPPEPRALQWTRLARGIAGLHCRRDTRALYTTGSKSHATALWPLVTKIYIDGLYAYLCPCSISQCKTGLKYSLRATGVAESDHLRKTKQASSKDKHEAPETDRCLCGEELPKNPRELTGESAHSKQPSSTVLSSTAPQHPQPAKHRPASRLPEAQPRGAKGARVLSRRIESSRCGRKDNSDFHPAPAPWVVSSQKPGCKGHVAEKC